MFKLRSWKLVCQEQAFSRSIGRHRALCGMEAEMGRIYVSILVVFELVFRTLYKLVFRLPRYVDYFFFRRTAP